MDRPNGGRSGDRIIRRPRLREIRPRVLRFGTRRRPIRLFATPLLLLYGFIILIVAGGTLLLFPFSSADGSYTPAADAFFTSTSAVTVTGLTVVSTTEHWSTFGHGVIFALMLIGGLGFMSFATFLLILIGQRITLPERMMIRDTLGGDRLGGVVRLLRRIVLVVVAIYTVGMLLIFWQMLDLFPAGEAIWQAAFLSVSSFNNAGFAILPDSVSVEQISRQFGILTFMGVLIVLGGIGWVVIVDVYGKRRFSRLSLDTKMIIIPSLFLWLAGALVFFLSEYSNDATVGMLSLHDKVFYGVFESISGRTAGFSTIAFSEVNDLTKLFFISLMFIGGGAGSVAGGIKVGTFAVIVAVVLSSLRGRQQAEAFGREIPQFQVHRALTVAILGGGLIFIISLALTLSETDADIAFLDMLFESVSAFGTTGLSMGVAPLLTVWGKMMLIILMVLGRLGPLALALALTPREEPTPYRYAQERVRIG